MKRDSRKNKNSKSILYLSGSILGLAVIALIVTFSVYNNSKNTNKDNLNSERISELVVNNTRRNSESEEASTKIGKTVEESKNEVNTVVENKTIENSTNTVKQENTNTTQSHTTTKPKEEKKEEPIKDPTFTAPVQGEIMREFAKENLVYSATLKEWVTHNGIDIKAEKSTVVKASAKGSVKSIKNDPRYGTTVVIEHVNGFETVYANLLTAEFVTVGEAVESGQTLGTVGNSATFEIADETHLHFEILKDGQGQDPKLFIQI